MDPNGFLVQLASEEVGVFTRETTVLHCELIFGLSVENITNKRNQSEAEDLPREPVGSIIRLSLFAIASLVL